MPGYYTERLAAERLRACYDLALPRTKAYLEAEIEFVLAKTTPSTLALEPNHHYALPAWTPFKWAFATAPLI